ncbi:MAG: 5'-methylthioadenosine/S-adenosylhomocysteine nucleosidase [Synechococcales cyanobacterium CRU_2_2]|nr:5'-methylthioadenosine/S-adenosylhomocysteine nucleosidase [Synechococcales cyanobacterium CRU_2_2]
MSALSQGQLAGARRVLVLGVAGSLSPRLGVGAVVIYERVVSPAGGHAGRARRWRRCTSACPRPSG